MIRMAMGAAALIFAMLAVSSAAFAVESGKTLTWPGGGRGEVRFEGREHAKKAASARTATPASSA